MRLKTELTDRHKASARATNNSEGTWAAFELAWVEELEQAVSGGEVPRSLRARLSAVRIGDLYVAAFPFEIYSQIGMDLRRRLEPRHVLIAGYTNGLIGYVPTDRAKDQGGYGPAKSHRFFPSLLTAIGRGADGLLVRSVSELLMSLV